MQGKTLATIEFRETDGNPGTQFVEGRLEQDEFADGLFDSIVDRVKLPGRDALSQAASRSGLSLTVIDMSRSYGVRTKRNRILSVE